MKKTVRPLHARFWAKVRVTDGCWLWQGAADRYGIVMTHWRAGADDGLRQKEWAHRVSYVLAFGPIPAGLHVCHHCDTPLCVRPDHLFLGTHLENMQDCKRKGRTVVGERMGGARLTWPIVRAIRAARPRGTIAHRAIARKYGVSLRTIYRVTRYETWPEHADPYNDMREAA